MIKHSQIQQGTLEWMQLRAGRPTASEFNNLVTSKFEMRKGEMPKSYLAEKCAERVLGGPLPGFSSWATDQGSMLEDEAVPFLELLWDTKIERVGFCTTDDGKAGCSPDGLLGDVGLEIKCPEPKSHCKYLLAGVVPDDYLPQIHFSMFVTGFTSWRFVSYRRHFPPLILTVQRDEEIQKVLAEVLADFLKRLDDAHERILAL